MIKPPARKGEQNRVRLNTRIDVKTMEIITHLKELWSKSLGEVIDQLAKEQTND